MSPGGKARRVLEGASKDNRLKHSASRQCGKCRLLLALLDHAAPLYLFSHYPLLYLFPVARVYAAANLVFSMRLRICYAPGRVVSRVRGIQLRLTRAVRQI